MFLRVVWLMASSKLDMAGEGKKARLLLRITTYLVVFSNLALHGVDSLLSRLAFVCYCVLSVPFAFPYQYFYAHLQKHGHDCGYSIICVKNHPLASIRSTQLESRSLKKGS
jgi:hypothetical protein